MGYKEYFTLSVTAFVLGGILLILSVILFFKMDIKNIIKIFLRKLRVIIILILPLIALDKKVYSYDVTENLGAEIRFKTSTFTGNGIVYYPDLKDNYFTFFVKAKNPKITDTMEVYVDDILCFRSLSGDSLGEEIPIMLRMGYEPEEIKVVSRAKSGNETKSMYYLKMDNRGPVINEDSIEVLDTKGAIGMDKRIKAFITGENTVTVKIKDVRDDESGINSLYFKYYTKNAEHTIRGEYDSVSGEYFAIINLPKNEKRKFFVITRDNLFNLSTTEEGLIDILTDNTKPSLEIEKEGDYYEKSTEEIVYKEDISFKVSTKDEVGIKDVYVLVNKEEIIGQEDIYSSEGGLLKEMNFSFDKKDLKDDKNDIEIMVRNYGGHETKTEFTVFSDNTAPVISKFYISSIEKNIGQKNPVFYFNKDIDITLTLEDYDDFGNKRDDFKDIAIYLYDLDGNILDKRDLVCDKDGNISFNLRCGFIGYGILKARDIFSNELYFKTGNFILEGREEFFKNTKIEIKTEQDKISSKEVKLPVFVRNDFSGIKEVKYMVESPNDTEENREGSLPIVSKSDGTKTVSGTGELVVKNNSNDIKVKVILISNCENIKEESVTLNIDKTYPVITGEFTDGLKDYYINHNRTLRIEITERNFNPKNFSLTILKDGAEIKKNKEFELIANENPDYNKHILNIEFDEEGEYSIYGGVRDTAGNASSLKEKKFVIDKTKPTGEITYDRPLSEGEYINSPVEAKITIIEDNLDISSVKIVGENIIKDQSYTYEKGVYTANLYFDKSGEYKFSITGKDLSGNLLNDLLSEKFILDLTNPNVLIYDLINHKSYNDSFGFQGVIEDKNLDTINSKISLIKESKGENLNIKTEISEGKISFRVEQVDKLPEYDGIYTLNVLGTDLAGNRVDETFRFSINRFGSTFMSSKELKEISNSYTRVMGNVDIVEVNYDEINPESTRVFLFRNGNTRLLNMEKDYEVFLSNNGYLNSLTYSIKGDNFSEDGIYALSVYSKDNAGNINVTGKDDSLISFVVDRTMPRIYSLNVSSNEEYTKFVKMEVKAFDNMKLKKVWATNNNESIEVKEERGKYNINLPVNKKKYNIKLFAEDAAGNLVETKINNISVGVNKELSPKEYLLRIILSVIFIMSIIVLFAINLRRKNGKRKDNRAY